MKKKVLLIFFLLIFSINILTAGKMDFSGYYKSFFIVFKPVNMIPWQNEPASGLLSNHIRLNFLTDFSSNLSFELSYDFIPKIEANSNINGLSNIFNYTSQYRMYDLSEIIFPKDFHQKGGNFALYQNLDRAFFKLKLDFADVYIGRQAISWGSGKIINPTDIFAPFSFNELDKEERRGVDAVRVRIPTGDLSEIDVGYVAGDRFRLSNSGFFFRSKLFMLNTDLSFMIIGFRNNLLLGVDLARAVGGAGLWFEGAYVKNNFYNKDKEVISNNYTRISMGLDYNYKGVYMMIEYHYNGAGSKLPQGYYDLFNTRAYRTNSIFLMGINYVSIMSSYQITGLLSNVNMIIYNINDKSILLSPKLEYNISENIYLSLGAFISIGKSSSYSSYIAPPAIRSEFGMYPNMFYSSFRVYF